MKTKVLLIAIFAVLFAVNNSIRGQVVTTITTAGDHIVSYGGAPDLPLTKIVAERVGSPSLVRIGFGWTVNSWSGPNGHPETGSTANFITASLPGPYGNVGDGGGGTTVSYISDPWIGRDAVATEDNVHLSDPRFINSDGIRIEAQNFVSLKLSSLFANYTKQLYKDEMLISSTNLDLTIQETGHYALLTKSGSSSPGEIIYFDVLITGSTTPTAYTITYHLNGGIGTETGTYTIESETIALPIPTKAGYIFQGWYDNESLTGSAVTTIPSGSTGNKAFWAKWDTTNSLQITNYEVQPGETVAIYDISGRKIFSSPIFPQHTLDFSSLSSGVYVVKITSAGEPPKTAKFIKKSE